MAATGRYLWHLDWRIRLGVAATTTIAVFLAWSAIGALGAVNTARAEVADLISQSAGLSVGNLLESSVYAQLASQSDATADALDDVSSKLRVFRPFELFPFLGGRLRAGRNTIELGTEFAAATGIILRAYGEALDERGSSSAVETALVARIELLAKARFALERADELLANDTVLSVNEQRSMALGITFLKSLAIMALQAPTAVEDGFQLLVSAKELRDLASDPLSAISDTGAVRDQLELLMQSIDGMNSQLAPLATDDGALLLADALVALETAAVASSNLLSAAEAVELGLLSRDFGRAAGAYLASASSGFRKAGRQFSELLNRVAPLTGDTDQESEEGRLDSLFSAVERSLEEAAGSVDMIRRGLGYEGERIYLIVMQNQNEIRATGGFIGATLEVPVDEGVLGEISYLDSSQVDTPPLVNNPAAPEPIFWYLWISRLLFRDANWNPDFPHTAQTLISMYEDNLPVDLSGAVSATKLFAFDLVDIVGGVRVAGVEEVITRELAYVYSEGLLPYACQDHHVSFKGKRCFDEDLVEALFTDLRSGLGDGGLSRLADVMIDHLDHKNMLIYLEDEEAQARVVSSGWGGHVGVPSQDMLMVLDSSLPGHTTAAVTRTWEYDLELVPEGVSNADLRIHFENARLGISSDCRQAAEGGGGCYWNYLRIFLPEAAAGVRPPHVAAHEGAEKLIWGYRDLDTARVETHAGSGLTGLVEIGGFVVVEPSQVVTVPVRYELSPVIMRSVGAGRYEYRLELLKQPGVDRDLLDIEIRLPAGSELLALSPSDAKATERGAAWTGQLTGDAELVVVFEVP